MFESWLSLGWVYSLQCCFTLVLEVIAIPVTTLRSPTPKCLPMSAILFPNGFCCSFSPWHDCCFLINYFEWRCFNLPYSSKTRKLWSVNGSPYSSFILTFFNLLSLGCNGLATLTQKSRSFCYVPSFAKKNRTAIQAVLQSHHPYKISMKYCRMSTAPIPHTQHTHSFPSLSLAT